MISNIIIVNEETTQKARAIAQPQPDGVNVLLELIAEEGLRLTQFAEVSIEDRIVCKGVVLPNGMSTEDWKEITEEEANIILEEKHRLEELEREQEKPIIEDTEVIEDK